MVSHLHFTTYELSLYPVKTGLWVIPDEVELELRLLCETGTMLGYVALRGKN